MKKLNDFNYDADEVVKSESLKPGIYLCKILAVTDFEDKEYLELKIDIEKGDFKGYFQNQERAFGYYPSSGKSYQSYKETSKKFFQAFITAIRKSNPNFVWNWNEQTLVNKLFVGNFGEEEYEKQDGTIGISIKLREIRSIEAFKNNEIKELSLKKLKKKQEEIKQETISEINIDDLPF